MSPCQKSALEPGHCPAHVASGWIQPGGRGWGGVFHQRLLHSLVVFLISFPLSLRSVNFCAHDCPMEHRWRAEAGIVT